MVGLVVVGVVGLVVVAVVGLVVVSMPGLVLVAVVGLVVVSVEGALVVAGVAVMVGLSAVKGVEADFTMILGSEMLLETGTYLKLQFSTKNSNSDLQCSSSTS